MATTAEAGKAVEGNNAEGKKKSALTLVAVLLLVLVAGGAGAAWFFGVLPIPRAGAGAGEAGAEAHGEGADQHGQPGAIRPLDPFLANLADEGGGRYLKTTIQVEFVAAEAPQAFDLRMPQIRDAVLTLLTSRTFADIRTPAGKESLRDDVIDRLNQVLQSSAVKAVYFTEFVVQ